MELISDQKDSQVTLNKLLKQASARFKQCTHQQRKRSGLPIPIIGPAIDMVDGMISELGEAIFPTPRNCSNIDRCMDEIDAVRLNHKTQVGKVQDAERDLDYVTRLNGQCIDREREDSDDIIIFPRDKHEQDHDLYVVFHLHRGSD